MCSSKKIIILIPIILSLVIFNAHRASTRIRTLRRRIYTEKNNTITHCVCIVYGCIGLIDFIVHNLSHEIRV